MAAPKVYKSTDANAPVLTGSLGSLISLLDAVFVNGYGEKASLGWSKEFSGANKAVYRPSAGPDRLFYRIQDTSPNWAWVSAYEAMTDVDTGTGMLTQQAAIGVNHSTVIGKSHTADTTSRAWCIVGDSYGAYIFVLYGGGFVGTQCAMHYLGQPISLPGSSNHGMIMGCGQGNNANYLYGDTVFHPAPSNIYARLHRSWDGVSLGIPLSFAVGTAIPCNYNYSESHPTAEGLEYISSDVLACTTDRPAVPRIKFPGLRIGAHSSIGYTICGEDIGNNLLRFPVSVQVSSGTGTAFKRYFLIDISESYRT